MPWRRKRKQRMCLILMRLSRGFRGGSVPQRRYPGLKRQIPSGLKGRSPLGK